MKVVGKSDGNVGSQGMQGFRSDRWSDHNHLWWTGAKPGSHLELELPIVSDGTYNIEVVFTRAPDYGIVQLSLEGENIGQPIDLYAPTVVTSGVLVFPDHRLKAGKYRLRFDILGANPQAAKAYMIGVDYVRLMPSGESRRIPPATECRFQQVNHEWQIRCWLPGDVTYRQAC